jgi:hypothetical protein
MQIGGVVAGSLAVAFSVTLGPWIAARVWRDPAYADMITQGGRVLPFGYATGRGNTRALVPMFTGIGLVGAGAIATSVLPAGPVHKASPLFVLALVFFALGILFLGLAFSVIWFNRPQRLVPPHMRGEDGLVTAWWRGRDLPPAERRAAARARRTWPALDRPAPTARGRGPG